MARIAQAVVHFEPALDDEPVSGGDRCRNWRDNPCLGGGRPPLSRAQSIARIGQVVSRANTHRQPVDPTLQLQNLMAFHDWEEYRWTLAYEDPDVAICFSRSAGAERTGSLVLWANFVNLFVQAAISCPSPAQLQRIPANRTGLRQFLSA